MSCLRHGLVRLRFSARFSACVHAQQQTVVMPRRHFTACTRAQQLSPWRDVPLEPADPILGLVAAFKADSDVRKVNLAQGAYRTSEGEPLVFDAVLRAERAVVADIASGKLNKEYLGIEG